MKFVSRSEWGARSPGARTSAPSMAVGVAVHWLGPGSSVSDHAGCAAQMRQVQSYHMGSNGWADFAYNAAACRHGYVFEGRGPKVRNAANGGGSRNGSDANAGWASVLYMEGTDGPGLTPEGQDAINDAAEWLGVAGGEWLGHRDFLSTECPGGRIYDWVHGGHPRSSGKTPKPKPKEDELFSKSPVASTHIIAAHSGQLLTSTGDTHGSAVVQHPANGSLNQRWQMVGHEDGTVSYVCRAGDLALDRPDYATEAGTALQVARCEYNDAQRWQPEDLAPFLVRLWAPGTNRCLDVTAGSQDANAPLQLWYGNDQRWQSFVFAFTV